jgi:hypothetical protein
MNYQPCDDNVITGTREELEESKRMVKEDYNFYARVLKAIYKKSKLRKKVIAVMKKLENVRYSQIPDCR